MKHTKRILSFLLAALLAFGVAIPAAHAAPDDSTQIMTIGGDDSIFEYFNGLQWNAMVVPFWFASSNGGNIAFCLESNKTQPTGDGYHISSALYSENVLAGVRSILIYGYPNNLGGLTETQCWYATQVAIWTWMWEAAGVGYESMAEHNMRPTAGNQAVYNFYKTLLERARLGMDTVNYSARFNPHPVVLRPNGSGRLVGTTTIEFLENVDSYSIDQTMLPANVSINGNTYRNDDTVTVTAPLEYAGKTFTTYDIFHLNSNRTPANIFWYEPDVGDLQKMVVFDMSFQPAAAIPLTITCEDAPQTGFIRIEKRTSDGSSPHGFQFSVERDSVHIGTFTTDAQGRVTIPDLQAGTYYVREVNIPEDYAVLGENIREVTVTAGETAVLDFFNNKKEGRLIVKKVNSDPGLADYSLAGGIFDIYDYDDVLVDTITTDANGIATSKMLPWGFYSVIERLAPDGYIHDGSHHWPCMLSGHYNTTEDPTVLEITIPNAPQLGKITINKKNADAAMGNHSLAGAVFEIFNGSTLVDTVTTNAQGVATSKSLKLGTYTVKEKTAPQGFVLNPNSFTAKLEYAGQHAQEAAVSVDVPEQPQTGKISIKKANANPALGDYSLQGAVFEIYSGSTLVDTVTTNAQGEAQSKTLKLGSYTVKEKTAPHGYVLNPDSFTVNLEYAGQDVELAVASVTVPEQPQVGVIRLTKTNANPAMGDHSLAGAAFEIRDAQDKLVDTITTDAQGKANSKELPLGSYTVSEKTAPTGFVRNQNSFGAQLTYAGQDVTIVYADVTVAEQPQVGKITVTKKDSATGDAAQGEAVLTGAVFEVYAGDKTTLLDTLYCGDGVTATTKELPLGTYFVKEKTAPAGYNLDEEFHEVKLEYAGQDVDVTSAGCALKNKVIEGQIAIVKHIDEAMEGYDDPQIEQPLEGTVFEIYLSAAGSYTDAKETERDRITTNENGYAMTKKLPYGLYTVHEVEAPGDVKMVAPFEVFISQEGKIYRFILNDPALRTQVKIVKVDAETGKPVLLAGTTFKIKDLTTGEFITQHVSYPTSADISEFETAADGTLMLPEPLKSGEYELVEIVAPRGYLLSSEPVKFTVQAGGGEEIVTITMKNKPVMGKVKVEKTGNMLKGAKEIETIFGKQYLPIFEMGYLAGAEFDVIAAADIVTPDGTVRAKKGDVVDHIVTGDDGQATSKELYLGEYELIETKAPANYVLDSTPHPVTLAYENQTVAVVTSQIGIMNARQLVEIELLKKMEGHDKFDRFEDVIFGLYAAEDIYADGKLIIAKDSLIIVQDSLVSLSSLDKDGRGRFEGELPFAKYYVLELQTAAGFVLDGTKYPVDASYTGADNAVTRIKVNGGEAIINKRSLGELRVLKLDAATNKPLKGAKFGVYQGDKKIGEAVTDDKGYALFSGLAFGEYKVRELEAPAGYVLVDEIWTINIRENGQKVLLEVLNQKQPGEPEQPDEPDEPEIPKEPEVPVEPTEPDEPDKPVPPFSGLPKTGDDIRIIIWAATLCLAAGIAAVTLLIRRKKENESEEPPDETE